MHRLNRVLGVENRNHSTLVACLDSSQLFSKLRAPCLCTGSRHTSIRAPSKFRIGKYMPRPLERSWSKDPLRARSPCRQWDAFLSVLRAPYPPSAMSTAVYSASRQKSRAASWHDRQWFCANQDRLKRVNWTSRGLYGSKGFKTYCYLPSKSCVLIYRPGRRWSERPGARPYRCCLSPASWGATLVSATWRPGGSLKRAASVSSFDFYFEGWFR